MFVGYMVTSPCKSFWVKDVGSFDARDGGCVMIA